MRQLKIEVLSVLVVTDKLEFVGKLFEARDFSPGYMHRDFGTKVPCSDNAKVPFVVESKQYSLIAGAIMPDHSAHPESGA